MGVSFADYPEYSGFNDTTRFDAYLRDCEVIGAIPGDMNGSFYRLQCDYQYPPPKDDWLFNADGHLSLFRFDNGHCEFIGRYVQTDRLMAERSARQRLFGRYRNVSTDDPRVKNIDHTAANTHMYWHGGNLYVLKEDSLPCRVDPHTLDYIDGNWDFNGKYKATSMSAHPKIDPVTGAMIAYGYQAKGDLSLDVATYTFKPNGEVTHEAWFKAPYLGIMHDIAITQKHIVFPVVAMVTSKERLTAGHRMWEWRPEYDTMVGILPRDGDGKDIRWFRGPSRNTLHFLNAVTEGDKVIMDLPVSDQRGAPSQIKRWTFDLNSKDDTFKEEVISTSNGQLARMDDRFLSLPYRFGWLGHSDNSKSFDEKRAGRKRGRLTNCIRRYDLRTGKENTFWVGDVQSLQEPCFVPRDGSTEEGDGYFVSVVSNFAEMASELVIVNAQEMEAGAVATVKLPFRLRSGTHGNWFSKKDLPFG